MNITPVGKAFVSLNNFLDGKISKKLGLRGLLERSISKVSYRAAKMGSKKPRKFKSDSKDGEVSRMNAKKQSDLFDLSYTEEQKMVQESIVEFVDRFIWSNAEESSQSGKIDDNIYKEFDKLGLQYYAVPTKFGGFVDEKSTVTQMIILEELAKGDLGMAAALLTPISSLNAFVNFGNAEQQEKYIPSFLDEENKLFATIAVNEGETIFDPYKLKTKVKEKGGKFVLNGEKTIVPLGSKAELFLVAAELEGKGPQVFIVESGLKGIEIQEESTMGLTTTQPTNLFFKDVELDKASLLGGDNGMEYQNFISQVRLAWCSVAVGTCQKVLEYVIEYCNNRVAFGEPITHRQAVAFMIANIKIELDGMRLITQRAVSKIEQGMDANKEAYLAALFCSERAMEIGNNGVQLLGGHGFIRDFPVERWYRDLRAVAISYNGLHI